MPRLPPRIDASGSSLTAYEQIGGIVPCRRLADKFTNGLVQPGDQSMRRGSLGVAPEGMQADGGLGYFEG
jgi:hypothetical protein